MIVLIKNMMLSIIQNRRSTVCFDNRPVPLEILKELFEAARWAPSSFNQQPWRFITGNKGTSSYNKIFDCLSEANQIWAVNAPILLVTVAQSNFSHNSKPNMHAWHDTAMAYSNLVNQATSLDLYLHPMAGFSSQKIIENFFILDDFKPVIAAALGYKGTCENMPESLISRENRKRERMELNEFVFEEKWGKPLAF